MPTYRYKLTDPTLARLANEVPGSPSVGSLAPALYIDVTLSNSSYLSDLNEAMALRGYAYFATDPTLTPAQQANATSGAASPYTGVSRQVRVASTSNIPTISGLLTIDGVTVSAGDRVLLKDQTVASQNGIYVAASGTWSYATDWETGAVVPEHVVFVSEGTSQAHTKWRIDTQGTITVGSTSVVFVKDSDTDAFHKSTSGEINSLTEKATPVSADLLLAEDSANSYAKRKVQVGNLPFVPPGRTLTAGAGLTGGGDLSADRTFNVGANADGSIVVNANDIQVGVLATDAQHGNRGGGNLHSIASVSGAGFLPKSNFSATTNPTVNDDNTVGYAVGSRWVNTSTDEEYVATDVSTGAALWKSTTASGGGSGGDNISVNGVAASDANFSDSTPAAPAGEVNVKWQKDTSTPNNISASVQASSETQKGVIEIATQTETDTGTDDTRAVTPLKLATTPLAGRDTTAIHDNVSAEISAISEKTTPVAADLLIIEDSAASYAKKKVQIGNLPRWPWSKSKVLTVGPDADYSTIGSAIAAATNGDIIMVAPGQYAEKLVISTSLTIVGLAPPVRTFDAAPSFAVLNPTLTTSGERCIDITAGSRVILKNLRVCPYHQATASDTTYGLYAGPSSTNLLLDSCIIAPEVASGAGAASFSQGTFISTGVQAEFRNCELSVDDPLNVISTGDGNPLNVSGSGTVCRLIHSRVRAGTNWNGDVSVQNSCSLELISSVIEGQLKEEGIGGTTVYVDSACRINSVDSADYTDDDTQTKLQQRSYGVADTGGQKSLYKLNLRNLAGDVGSPGNGNVWYSTVSNKFRVRENGTTKYLRSILDSSKVLTVDVNGGSDFTTIQAAIDAAAVDSQTTILIAPGVYTGGIVLKSGVHLIGLGDSNNATGSSPGQAVRVSGGAGTPAVAFSGSGLPARVSGIEFYQFKTGASTFHLISHTGTGWVYFEDCAFHYTWSASGTTAASFATQTAGKIFFEKCALFVDYVTGTPTFTDSALWTGSALNIDLRNTEALLGAFDGACYFFHVGTGASLTATTSRIQGLYRTGSGSVTLNGSNVIFGSLGTNGVTGDADDGSGAGSEFVKNHYGVVLRNGTSDAYKLSLRNLTAAPSGLANGNIWYDSTLGKFRGRENGLSVNLREDDAAIHDNVTGEINALTQKTTPVGTDLLLIEDSADSYSKKKVPWSSLPSGGGGSSPGGTTPQVQYNNSGTFGGASKVEVNANGSLELLLDSSPATPATDKVGLFGWKVSGRMMSAVRNPLGVVDELQALLGRKTVALVRPNGNSTTVSVLGFAVTATGTATTANWASTNLYTSMRRIDYLVTTASTTAVAGFRGAAQQWWRGNAAGLGGWFSVCRWGAATGVATATHRAFCGFRAATAAPTDVEPSSLTNILGMGWDAADTNIQFMHNDGTGTATKVNLGASFPVPTTDREAVYEIATFCAPNGNEIFYEISNLTSGVSTSGSVTTDIPSKTTALNYYGYTSVGGTSSVVGITLFGLYIETNY